MVFCSAFLVSGAVICRFFITLYIVKVFCINYILVLCVKFLYLMKCLENKYHLKHIKLKNESILEKYRIFNGK